MYTIELVHRPKPKNGWFYFHLLSLIRGSCGVSVHIFTPSLVQDSSLAAIDRVLDIIIARSIISSVYTSKVETFPVFKPDNMAFYLSETTLKLYSFRSYIYRHLLDKIQYSWPAYYICSAPRVSTISSICLAWRLESLEIIWSSDWLFNTLLILSDIKWETGDLNFLVGPARVY